MNIQKLLGFFVLGILVVVGFLYSKPHGGTPDIPDDPKAYESLELVQSHPGRNAPNLE